MARLTLSEAAHACGVVRTTMKVCKPRGNLGAVLTAILGQWLVALPTLGRYNSWLQEEGYIPSLCHACNKWCLMCCYKPLHGW
jgi:hypothetical protein